MLLEPGWVRAGSKIKGIVGTRDISAFLFPTIYRAILSSRRSSIVRTISFIAWTSGGHSRAEIFLGLGTQSCNDSEAPAFSLFRWLCKTTFMSILLIIQSYARSLLSADVTSFPIIRLCLSSSRPSRLLIQASLQY